MYGRAQTVSAFQRPFNANAIVASMQRLDIHATPCYDENERKRIFDNQEKRKQKENCKPRTGLTSMWKPISGSPLKCVNFLGRYSVRRNIIYFKNRGTRAK